MSLPSASALRPRACLAEDDPLLRRVTSMTLGVAGFAADVFEDGLAASAAVEAAPGRFDVVILDGNMGGGDRDGLETLRRLSRFFGGGAASAGQPGQPPPGAPPVVILTGETDPAEHALYLGAGAARVIVKPAKLEQFQALQELVAKRRAQQAFPAVPVGWLDGAAAAARGPPGGESGGRGETAEPT